jgi:hypothetical protein
VKTTSAVLALSLAANVALAGYLALKSPAAPPATAAPATANAARPSRETRDGDALRAALASGDVAALEAAGLSSEVARQLVLGRAMSRYAERMRALQPGGGDGKWWKNRSLAGASREQLAAARREFGEAVSSLLGDDLPGFNGDSGSLSFLPAAKRDALRRITQDYDEMMAKFSASGIQLPSDREKLKLLRAERDRDIAALLSPAELAEYELRTSPAAATVRARYGDAIESEDDFRKIFALQKAFDEKYPREALTGRISPELLQQRAAADRQLQDDLRAALGDEKYAALRRASDSDLRNVDSLAQRLNLPPDTTTQVATAREAFAAESQRINSDTSVPLPQRRQQIQELAARARSQLAQTLGAEAGEAYAQRAPWVSMLQSGMAYSTNPNDAPAGAASLGNQSVFPVIPAGVNVGGAAPVRQMVNIVSSDGPAVAAPSGGALFFAPEAGARQVDATQVFSVVSSGPVTRSSTSSPPAATNTSGTTPPAATAPATPAPKP